MKDKISGYGMDDGYWLINHSSVIEAADAILAALSRSKASGQTGEQG
jgi:hypothetical protein